MPTPMLGQGYKPGVGYNLPEYEPTIHKAGASIWLTGLSREELNHQQGHILSYDATKGRIGVKLSSGALLSVKPKNVAIITPRAPTATSTDMVAAERCDLNVLLEGEEYAGLREAITLAGARPGCMPVATHLNGDASTVVHHLRAAASERVVLESCKALAKLSSLGIWGKQLVPSISSSPHKLPPPTPPHKLHPPTPPHKLQPLRQPSPRLLPDPTRDLSHSLSSFRFPNLASSSLAPPSLASHPSPPRPRLPTLASQPAPRPSSQVCQADGASALLSTLATVPELSEPILEVSLLTATDHTEPTDGH